MLVDNNLSPFYIPTMSPDQKASAGSPETEPSQANITDPFVVGAEETILYRTGMRHPDGRRVMPGDVPDLKDNSDNKGYQESVQISPLLKNPSLEDK